MANPSDHDQIVHLVAYDVGLHCLQRSIFEMLSKIWLTDVELLDFHLNHNHSYFLVFSACRCCCCIFCCFILFMVQDKVINKLVIKNSFFVILALKHILWVLLELPLWGNSNEHPQDMFHNAEITKILSGYLFYLDLYKFTRGFLNLLAFILRQPDCRNDVLSLIATEFLAYAIFHKCSKSSLLLYSYF